MKCELTVSISPVMETVNSSNNGKHVVCESLYRKFAFVAHSELHGKHQSDEQHDCGEDSAG